MTDTSSPSNDGEQMRAVVTNYGTATSKPDTIPEDLKPYAEQVLKMDPLRDVPGNVRDVGGERPIKLEITALPPELQGEVHRKLEAMPRMDAADRAKYVDKFVAEAIRGKLGSIRGTVGVGPDALPYHKEQADIAMQVRTLYRKRDEYQNAVDKIVDVRKAEDPNTGEVIAEPVYWMSDTKRVNFTNAIADIDRQIRLLVLPDGKFGIEGEKRMQKALAESAKLLRDRKAAHADEAEAQKRSEQMLRDERINRRAEVLAKMRRGSTR